MLREAFRRPGFTALELILVLAIFVVTAGVTLPFLGKFRTSETLETHAQEIVQTLRRAQHKSLAGQRDSAWGVQFQAGEYILFAGTSYATRNTAFDESHKVTGNFTFSGSGELVFRKISGAAMTGGTVTLAHTDAGSRSVEVNSAGAISLQ